MSLYKKQNDSTSTLRPRNNRLISYNDDDEDGSLAATASRINGNGNNRSVSPNNLIYGNSSDRVQEITVYPSREHKRAASESFSHSRGQPNSVWESWSNISGMASNLLGAGQQSDNSNIKRTNSVESKQYRVRMQRERSLQPKIQEWGPTQEPVTKSEASYAEQRAILQAKRRELLMRQGNEAQRDSLGRFKRKDSNADMRPHSSGDSDTDVLAYRHKVQPGDTMAGIAIRYSCGLESFRKANRFWPNDNIQHRDQVILPIESCSIRGRKVDNQYALDQLSSELEKVKIAGRQGQARETDAAENLPDASTTPSPSNSPFPKISSEDSQIHESWVLLPNFSDPVEIIRIPKNQMSYFPRARRKSNNLPFSDSEASTPRTSFDTLRHPPSHAAQQAAIHQAASASAFSPTRNSSIPRHLTDLTRSRSPSTIGLTKTNSSSTSFATLLQGPGGVGTLSGLRTEIARPGPAEDGLNRKYAQYLPDVRPPEQKIGLHDSNLLCPPHGRQASGSLLASPRLSTESARSARSNSGGLEGWMRKAAGAIPTSPLRRGRDAASKHVTNMGSDLSRAGLMLDGLASMPGDLLDGSGDLIELITTPNELSRQLHDAVGTSTDDDRTPTLQRSDFGFRSNDTQSKGNETPTRADREQGKASAGNGLVAVDESSILDDRFPVRGRVTRAYSRDHE